MEWAFYCVIAICVCSVVYRVIQFFENFWVRQHEYEKLQFDLEKERIRHECRQMEHEKWVTDIHETWRKQGYQPEPQKGATLREIDESNED